MPPASSTSTSSTAANGRRNRPALPVRGDRSGHWVYLRIYADQSEASSTNFLRRLHTAAQMKIDKLLTDNGSQFTDRFTSKTTAPTGQHAFDRECVLFGIEHRLITARHPHTNGMVERFNGRISDILATTRFRWREDLHTTIERYRTILLKNSILTNGRPDFGSR